MTHSIPTLRSSDLAQINKYSRFYRKNYFYADLPQGYQISQLYHPIVGEGSLTIEADEKAGIAADKAIGVERIHIEQDAGKLMHDQHPTMSFVDLNRSGVALMEIVSKPDMRSPAEARTEESTAGKAGVSKGRNRWRT